MSLIQYLYNLFLDAIFPLSPAEIELFSYSTEKAFLELPKSAKPPLTKVNSIFSYKDERVKKLIWNIKYKKSKPAIDIGGYALYKDLTVNNHFPNQSICVLIPMPITKRRRRERGFNQCEVLVNEIKNLDIENHFEINTDLLIRTHHTSRQTLKDRSHRLEDAKGIFSVNEKVLANIIAEQNNIYFIVIDDVVTTGSTMKEALNTLEKAGLTNVNGISLAH